MSTIEEFLESPSTSFQDVTDTILTRGGLKQPEELEASDGENSVVVGDEGSDDGSGELLEEAVASVDKIGAATVDSAVDEAYSIQVDKEVDTAVVTPAAVESSAADADEDEGEPEPRRRRRRH